MRQERDGCHQLACSCLCVFSLLLLLLLLLLMVVVVVVFQCFLRLAENGHGCAQHVPKCNVAFSLHVAYCHGRQYEPLFKTQKRWENPGRMHSRRVSRLGSCCRWCCYNKSFLYLPPGEHRPYAKVKKVVCSEPVELTTFFTFTLTVPAQAYHMCMQRECSSAGNGIGRYRTTSPTPLW